MTHLPAHVPFLLRLAGASVLLAVVAACGGGDGGKPADPPVDSRSQALAVSGPIPGAIFTTDAACNGTDVNVYANKDAVYLAGGPGHPGAAGLPDGSYHVRVTSPEGSLLGQSDGPVVTVTGGAFAQCYLLAAIVKSASSSFTVDGFDDTSNGGGEYKVWVSALATFAANLSKTDNFKVRATPTTDGSALEVLKYYDGNANGVRDLADSFVAGWRITIDGSQTGYTPYLQSKAPGTYAVEEAAADDAGFPGSWRATGPTLVNAQVSAGTTTVEFGNACFFNNLSGNFTIGYYAGNANRVYPGWDTAVALFHLRDAAGQRVAVADLPGFKAWMIKSNAVNMAYMLSAQMAATYLDYQGRLDSGIYVPDTGFGSLGGVHTVQSLLDRAESFLVQQDADGKLLVLAGDARRSDMEALKNVFDAINNNSPLLQVPQATANLCNPVELMFPQQ